MAPADEADGAECADGASAAAPPAEEEEASALTRRVSVTLHTELLRKFKHISGAAPRRARLGWRQRPQHSGC
jgi:hypothetical protein